MATEEVAVIGGLGIISFILAYYAFELRESQEDFWKKVSIGLFFMSLLFLNLVIFAVLLIAKNSSVAYLEDSVIVYGLMIMNWLTVVIILAFIIWVMYLSVIYTMEFLKGKFRGNAGDM